MERVTVVKEAYRSLVEPARDPPFIYARNETVCCLFVSFEMNSIADINFTVLKVAQPDADMREFMQKYGAKPYSHPVIQDAIIHFWLRAAGFDDVASIKTIPLPMIALAATTVSSLHITFNLLF